VKRALIFSSLGYDSGCALRARYLCDALKRKGWRAELILPPFRNLPFACESFLSLPKFAWEALSHPVDLAVGIKPYPNVWTALWIAKLRGAQSVVDVDDLDSSWRGGLLGKLSALIQAPAFYLLNLFSTHHPAIRESLADRGRTLDLGQGVDSSIFFPRRVKAERRLFYTAHLNVASQLDILMRWVSPWLERHSDWRLLIAGGGPRLSEYRRRFASPQVEFSGILSPEAVAIQMARAKICLSAYDASPGNDFRVPMKIHEYLAMAKPVLSNGISGLQSLKKFLYLCEPGEAAFSKMLQRLSEGRGDGREKRGAAWMKKNLSWDKVADRFLSELN